jgi:DNA-binding NtrC family response regulator
LRFSRDIQELFLRYRWPGNVRELRNLVQRLHPTSRRRDIQLSDLPPEISLDRPAAAAARAPDAVAAEAESPRRLKDAEKTLILRAIQEHNGNLSRVADALGITRPTLYRKLRIYNIERVFR